MGILYWTFWTIAIAAVIGFIFWYSKSKKKGGIEKTTQAPEKKEEAPQTPPSQNPPSENPGV